MDNSYTINFSGTRSKVYRIKEISQSLTEKFQVNYSTREKFSNFTGQDEVENLSMLIYVGEGFLDFVKLYVIKKGYDLILKETIFNPIYKWLESISSLDDNIQPDEIEFKFNDMRIKIAYSRRNHHNVVGQIILMLIKISPYIELEELGNLTGICSPVKKNENGKWKYFFPSEKFELREYLDIWGLEYNSRNRCVFEISTKKIIHEYWW